jgi:hypothetical protein
MTMKSDNTRFDWNHNDAAEWREAHQVHPHPQAGGEKLLLVILILLVLGVYVSLWFWPI